MDAAQERGFGRSADGASPEARPLGASGPVRIQRRRVKGWRMPPGAVYVGRPTRWGNPFVAHDWQASFRALALGERGDRRGRLAAAVKLFRLWITAETRPVDEATLDWWDREVMTVTAPKAPSVADIVAELRGKDLACWCPLDQPCHADVLLELANGPGSVSKTGEGGAP